MNSFIKHFGKHLLIINFYRILILYKFVYTQYLFYNNNTIVLKNQTD